MTELEFSFSYWKSSCLLNLKVRFDRMNVDMIQLSYVQTNVSIANSVSGSICHIFQYPWPRSFSSSQIARIYIYVTVKTKIWSNFKFVWTKLKFEFCLDKTRILVFWTIKPNKKLIQKTRMSMKVILRMRARFLLIINSYISNVVLD